jgi:hypothetical protein
MPNLPLDGFPMPGNLGVSSNDEQFGILSSQLLTGGYQEVKTLSEMYEIPIETPTSGAKISPDGLACGRRRVGMVVYIADSGEAFRLVPNGYFENGEGEYTDWDALTADQKAVLLDPQANYSYGFPETIVTGSGNPAECWLKIYPYDDVVDGIIPAAGDIGQVMVKAEDANTNWAVQWMDPALGKPYITKVSAVSLATSSTSNFSVAASGGTEEVLLATQSLPGVRNEDFWSLSGVSQISQTDIVAWRVNYKIVIQLTNTDLDPSDWDVWISDEENGTKFHPTTWFPFESHDRTTGGSRYQTFTGFGYIVADQGSAGNEVPVSTNVQLNLACKNNGTANGFFRVKNRLLEIEPILSYEFGVGTVNNSADNQVIGNIDDFRVMTGTGATGLDLDFKTGSGTGFGDIEP